MDDETEEIDVTVEAGAIVEDWSVGKSQRCDSSLWTRHMHMLLELVGETEENTEKEMILISSVVFSKLVRKDRNENRYQDDLR